MKKVIVISMLCCLMVCLCGCGSPTDKVVKPFALSYSAEGPDGNLYEMSVDRSGNVVVKQANTGKVVLDGKLKANVDLKDDSKFSFEVTGDVDSAFLDTDDGTVKATGKLVDRNIGGKSMKVPDIVLEADGQTIDFHGITDRLK